MKMEFLHISDQYYVVATSDLAHDSRVLKQGETFAIFDAYGDIRHVVQSQAGIFHKGVRCLSHSEFFFEGQRPLLLNSTLRDDNGVLVVDLTNKDFVLPNGEAVLKGTIHIHREKFLFEGCAYEQMTFNNFGSRDIECDISFHLACDFADIFEVRGMQRQLHGKLEPFRQADHHIYAPYMGLDNVQRTTVFYFPHDKDFNRGVLNSTVRIPKRQQTSIMFNMSFLEGEETEPTTSYEDALKSLGAEHDQGRQRFSNIHSSNYQLNEWMQRSTDDLIMMTTQVDKRYSYPYAGIPWFCCPFGRDGILTALEALWANPTLAKGVLEFLASTQATKSDPSRDADPGKILHEARESEMAKLNEIPFGRYYGSIDSTPLFVCLGGAYLSRTNDLATIRKLWPHFQLALEWITKYGDRDGDGFVEYRRESPTGLVHQGWKDSDDSIFHEDGTDASYPIALCEVQGYVYLAHLEGAKMATLLDETEVAHYHNQLAISLRDNFDKHFWLEDLGTYAIALDGNKKPCRIKSSNAGQCLFTGIVKPQRADRLIQTLMADESFSGWGIRTLASGQARYNPMSYHNGSVWPHDVTLIAWGFNRYGYKKYVADLFESLFRAATYMEIRRIPEVFCGFRRRAGEAPTLYPHACSPQAWSAASVFMMIQALLGLTINAKARHIHFEKPYLPDSVEVLKISNLMIDGASIDLIVQNYRDDVSVQVTNRHTGIKVTVDK
jgi:glycogen debranching enzyme